MTQIDFNKTIGFPFQGKEWIQRFGIVAGLFFIVSIIAMILSVAGIFTDAMIANMLREAGNATSRIPDEVLTQLGSSLISVIVSLITLPVALYTTGYTYKTIARVIKGDEQLPSHGDIKGTYKTAILGIVAQLPTYAIVLFTIIPVVVLAILAARIPEMEAVFIIATLLMTLVVIVLSLVLHVTLRNAMLNIYLLTGDIKKAYSLSLVMSYIKTGSIDYLWGGIIQFGIGILIGIIGLITICFYPIVTPILETASILIGAYIMGKIYADVASKVSGVVETADTSSENSTVIEAETI